MARTIGKIAAVTALMVLASGCATVTSGKDQTLSFETDPAGADCTLTQASVDVARFRTPSKTVVHRGINPLIVACSKPGYQQTRAMISTTISGAAWGNLAVGGIVGVMIDQSSGAAYRYYDPPRLVMMPAGEPAPDVSRDLATGVKLLPPTAAPMLAGETPVAERSTVPTRQATTAATPVPMPGPSRAAGALPSPGVWECGVRNGKRYYTLQIVVGANGSMVVTTYGNAPATIVSRDPLTFTALNPRGERTMTVVWNVDNTVTISGVNTTDPDTTFRNEGACTKV